MGYIKKSTRIFPVTELSSTKVREGECLRSLVRGTNEQDPEIMRISRASTRKFCKAHGPQPSAGQLDALSGEINRLFL